MKFGGPKMRVLLVVPRQTRMGSYSLPLGIGHISTSLKLAGHQVMLLNPNHSLADMPAFLKQAIDEFSPDIIATGGMSFMVNLIREITIPARELLPNTTIIIGGLLVSNQPAVSMTAIPEADIGVVGEGERTIVELVAALSAGDKLNTISGLIFRNPETGALHQTPPRAVEYDLDQLPEVDYAGLGLDIFAGLHRPGDVTPGLIVDSGARVMPVMTSRGCPYPCTFCCHESTGRRYRVRSLDRVFAEISTAVECCGINTLFVLDDLFGLKPGHIEEFCERVQPYGFRWGCSLRGEQISPALLKMLKESGCTSIGLGVESMSPPILESMKKKTSREKLEKALSMIYDAEICPGSNLIFGDPAETLETAMESLEWMVNNNRYDLRTALIGYHPGSRIYDDAIKNGLIKDPVKFLLSDSAEINGTALSGADFQSLQLMMANYTWMFGIAGRLVEFQQAEDGLWTFRAICPHCNTENVYSAICLDNPGIIQRISCKQCNRLYRFPIAHRKPLPKELNILVETLCLTPVTADRANEIHEICTRIVSFSMMYDQPWCVLIQLADILENSQAAIGYLEHAIIANPYSPFLFEEMSRRLTLSGQASAQKKFALKAAQLRQQSIESTTYFAAR